MPPLAETFSIDQGALVRAVVPARGKPYQHRCTRQAFENVAHAIDEAKSPFVMEDLAAATGEPFTQVAVALAFLKERGVVQPVHGRKHQRAGEDAHLDAMIEYHALCWQQEHPGEAT